MVDMAKHLPEIPGSGRLDSSTSGPSQSGPAIRTTASTSSSASSAPLDSAMQFSQPFHQSAALLQMVDTFHETDEEMMQSAVQEGNDVLVDLRHAWFRAVQASQIINLAVMWRAAFGRHPINEEIQTIMAYAASATVDEWKKVGYNMNEPGITAALVKASSEAHDHYAGLLEAQRMMRDQAVMAEQPVPGPSVPNNRSTAPVPTQELTPRRWQTKTTSENDGK
jgi:hypothetical protein